LTTMPSLNTLAFFTEHDEQLLRMEAINDRCPF